MKIKDYSKSKYSFHSQLKKAIFLNYFLSIVLLIISINSFGQQKSSSVENLLSGNNYFHNLQIEKFFLHTNKTSYFPGEKIWFKAYIVNDSDEKPSLSTSNLHINLYNSHKRLVSSNLFFVDSGKANGEIELSKGLPAGKYYIELTTQWNQNFDNNNSITLIDIISPNQNQEENISNSKVENLSITDQNKKTLNIQFFPESNILLENTKNTIVFTTTNNSSPVSINGDLIDDKTGIIVAKLASNKLGMGSFNLFLRPGRTYSVSFKTDDSKQQFTIQKPINTGFLITKNINQPSQTNTNFTIKTNDETLRFSKNKTLLAVLHRNGMANIVVPIKLKKKALNYSFSLKNEDLYNGINTITLFDKSNAPVSDFSFFNMKQQEIKLEITKVDEDKDSLTLSFDLLKESANTNLSVSILPEETKMYKGYSTIESALLIAPYLNDSALNLSEILTKKNKSNLDLFIAARIKKNLFPYKEEKKVIPSENGVRINGNVSANIADLTNYKVMLSSKESNILLIQPVGESNSFSFENLILKHPSEYKLALLDPQGKIVKTGFRLSNELITYKVNSTLGKTIKFIQNDSNNNNFIVEKALDDESANAFPLLTDDVNFLDEVKLSKKEKRENKLKELGISEDILENGFSKLYPIDEKESAVSIIDYFQRLAGIKVINDCPLYLSVRGTRGATSFMGVTSMSIFIDGIRIDDTVFLCSMKASEFIAVSTNSLGVGAGLQGEGGILNLYTRKGRFGNNSIVQNEDIVVSETDFGFTISENSYENQLFQYKNNDSRKFYGTIGWFPNIDIAPNSIFLLKLDKNNYKDFKVIVNGMNDEGKLIYKIVNINSDML